MNFEEKKDCIINLLYIILLLLMIAILLSIVIKYYTGFSEIEYVWFCSKILTMKKIIKDNKNEKILYDIDDTYLYYIDGSYYLDFLKNATKEGCPNNYKNCGLLDTYGNIFCLKQGVDCPMNEIILDSPSL